MSDVRYVLLTKGRVAKVDARDWPLVSSFKWYAQSQGYAARDIGSKARGRSTVLMHRFIVGPSLGQEVDHINGDKLDNRRANLRCCTHAQNMANKAGNRRRRDHQSRFTGVVRNGRYQSWRAEIIVGGVYHYLGSFKTELEAARARDGRSHQASRRVRSPEFPDDAVGIADHSSQGQNYV